MKQLILITVYKIIYKSMHSLMRAHLVMCKALRNNSLENYKCSTRFFNKMKGINNGYKAYNLKK